MKITREARKGNRPRVFAMQGDLRDMSKTVLV